MPMLKMTSSATLYYTPVIDLSDLSDAQARDFFSRCASRLDHLSSLFYDDMLLDEHGQLFTNTPLTKEQLDVFYAEMSDDLTKIIEGK